MLTITETPHRLPTCTWTAIDRADFCRTVHNLAERHDAPVWRCASAVELLAECDEATVDTDGFEPDISVAEFRRLAEQYGPNTLLYRADAYTHHAGLWTAEPIDEFEACRAWLAADLQRLEIVEEVER